MAGYQRHKFDTTYVQPSSDGGWGALARGFSNGYSMGKAIGGAINQRNVAKANADYAKGMEDLSKTDIVSPQELTGADGTQHAAIRLNEDQLDQLDNTKKLGETDERFKGTAYENMTQREYFDSQRNKMTQSDLDQRRRDLADKQDQDIKYSMLTYEGQDAYDEYKTRQMQNEAAEMELNRAKKFQSTIDSWNSGEAFSDPQNIAMLNATKDWLSGYMPGAGLERGEIVLGANGQLQVKDGDKFNDITPGALQTIKGTGISMALAMQGDLEGFKTWNAMASKRFSAMDDDKRTGIYAATSDARPDHTRGMKNPFGSLSPEEQRLISDYRKKNRKEAIPTDGDQ